MMGKTSQQLYITVPKDWADQPAIQDLVSRGHTVAIGDDFPDLILAPNAHYCTKEMLTEKLLEAALKRARKGKKEKKNGM